MSQYTRYPVTGGTPGNPGTVTSVGLTSANPAIIIANSPVTTGGNIDLEIQSTGNTVAGFNNDGNIFSIPGYSFDPDTHALNIELVGNATNINGIFLDIAGEVNGDYRALNVNSGDPLDGSFTGLNLFKSGGVGGSYTAVGSYIDSDIGSGSSSAIGLDVQFTNHVISGNVTGLNYNNTSSVVGNNNNSVISANNSGTGYRFTGVSISNNSNQTEEVRGVSFSSTAASRTATGLDISLRGSVTDDGNGARISINGMTGSNLVGLSVDVANTVSSDPQGVKGITTNGRIDVEASAPMASGQTFQIGNRIESLLTVAPGSPVTGTDFLGNDFAGDLEAQDDIALGPIGIGWNSVGFIASIGVAAAKTIDSVTVFLPAASLPDPGFTTGGNVSEFHMIRTFSPLPQGGTLNITNLYGLKIDSKFGPFGQFATNAWGVYVDSPVQNYLSSSLAIGTSNSKVSNSDVGLEVSNLKAVMLARMTTTQKLALSALESMVVYDTTLHKMSYYNGTAWVNV